MISFTVDLTVNGAHVRFTRTMKDGTESFYEGEVDEQRHIVAPWNQPSGSSSVLVRGFFSPNGRRFSGDHVSVSAEGKEYLDEAFVMFVNDGAASCPVAP